MDARLIHDHGDDMARQILATVRDCLMDHEHREAFEEFYRIAKEELEWYERERVRRLRRLLRPSLN